MTILVTGSAGFIGAALCEKLLSKGEKVVGIDNHNEYYDPSLKQARLERFSEDKNYVHYKIDISNSKDVEEVFIKHRFNKVVNLAAQAGVRFSIENPKVYVDSNLVGFSNILQSCRTHNIHHLIYASSSSVYGANHKTPFSTKDNVDRPVSFYAATKKANELMAHSYSHLFNLKTTGLRFFTVYGPWDRPDMALQTFTRQIIKGEPIKIFNEGKHKRDFTYIDDIVEGLLRVIGSESAKSSVGLPRNNWNIYNIGNNNPVDLIDYISELEKALGREAKKEYAPLQLGDMEDTYADIDDFIADFNYKPTTSISEGIGKFVKWYTSYFK